jgi:hypothetical protein
LLHAFDLFLGSHILSCYLLLMLIICSRHSRLIRNPGSNVDPRIKVFQNRTLRRLGEGYTTNPPQCFLLAVARQSSLITSTSSDLSGCFIRLSGSSPIGETVSSNMRTEHPIPVGSARAKTFNRHHCAALDVHIDSALPPQPSPGPQLLVPGTSRAVRRSIILQGRGFV